MKSKNVGKDDSSFPAYQRIIGSNIKSRRDAKGMTQDRLAYLMNYTRGHISHIESGQRGMSVATLLSFCEMLDTDSDSTHGQAHGVLREGTQGQELWAPRQTPLGLYSFSYYATSAVGKRLYTTGALKIHPLVRHQVPTRLRISKDDKSIASVRLVNYAVIPELQIWYLFFMMLAIRAS